MWTDSPDRIFAGSPSEQQRGPVKHQRHRCGHALLCRHFPLRGHCPRPPWGRGWRPQPCSCRREWREWRERTEQGGGGSSGAGLPHSSGAVCRSPPLDSLLRTDFKTGVQGKQRKQRLLTLLVYWCRWTLWTRLVIAVGTSYDLKVKLKQGIN